MNTLIFWNFDLTLNFEEIVFQNCWYNHFIGLPSPLSLLSTFVNNWLVPSHPFLLTQYVNVLQLIIDTSAIPKEKSHLISCLKRSATYKLTACPYSEFFWSLFFRIWIEYRLNILEKLKIRTLFTQWLSLWKLAKVRKLPKVWGINWALLKLLMLFFL